MAAILRKGSGGVPVYHPARVDLDPEFAVGATSGALDFPDLEITAAGV
jgi:hypothetical protein